MVIFLMKTSLLELILDDSAPSLPNAAKSKLVPRQVPSLGNTDVLFIFRTFILIQISLFLVDKGQGYYFVYFREKKWSHRKFYLGYGSTGRARAGKIS